jgi:hypothetical protein
MGNRREGGEAEHEHVPKVKVNMAGDRGYWSSGEEERESELEMLNNIVYENVGKWVGWERSWLDWKL